MSSSKSCTVCGTKTNLKSCSRCLRVQYCSRDHQQIHWKLHRIDCKRFIDPINSFKTIIKSNNSLNNQIIHNNSEQQLNTTKDIINEKKTLNDKHNSQLKQISAEEEVSEESAIESQMASLRVQESAIVSSVNYNHNKPLNSETNSQIFINNIPSNSGQNPMSSIVVNGFNNNQNNDSLISMRDLLICRQNNVLIKLNSYCETILRDLNEFGFCVIDNFLNDGTGILSEVTTLYELGLFKAGQLVNNKGSNTHLIRGDHIVWVDGTEQLCSNIGFLMQTLDSIVMRCNTMRTDGQFAKYRINRRTKAMIACYPGNHTKYVRHIDNPNNDGRCITTIYYLNKDYDRQRDGGVLRLFPQINEGCVADIEPKFDRVIFFWSDRRNPHEVMPSTRRRFAITVWYFDANEREKAIQRYKKQSLQYPVDKDLRPF